MHPQVISPSLHHGTPPSLIMACPHVQRVDRDTFRQAVKLYTAVATKNTDFIPQCTTCGSLQALACLQCSRMSCTKHLDHENHAIAVGLSENSQACAYCAQCNELVIDKSLDLARQTEISAAIGAPAPSAQHLDTTTQRAQYNSQQGLRGFYNMGATCYMAVCLQTLIHNPLVSQFFLAGGHDRSACKRTMCVQCCVDEIYCEFFSGETLESCGIPELLSAVVKSSSAMFSGASEQDAHEFLQFILDQFHQTHFSDPENSPSTDCCCISHRAFGGSLQNQLACEKCGFVKYMDDALMDISLQISGNTLDQCLKRFTAPEKLANYECGNCNERGGVKKSLKIASLPPILQIQLKRFRHDGVSSKVEQHVEFPLLLDLSEYTTTPDPKRPYLYELFGALCHYGSLDTGHYTCMMKHSSGVWYQFDDTLVSPVDVHKVLNSNAYLLFYCTRWSV